VEYRWTSRNNRKGRHQLFLNLKYQNHLHHTPMSTTQWSEIVHGIGRMVSQYPVWDISWLVAFIFTWGSILWVINGFFVFLPLVRPGSQFPEESFVGGGVTAFIGATIFEIGSILLILEAVNEHRSGCFGWAIQQALEPYRGRNQLSVRVTPDHDACTHHHPNKHNLLGKSASSAEDLVKTPATDVPNRKSWVWWPSFHELRTHFLHELGFLACLSQLIGATIFWIAGFTALPGIIDHLSEGLEDGIYWTPQVVGGFGFIISGLLFMLETQTCWYIPALDTLGWHIGLYNLIGGIGFTLSPAFGYDQDSWSQYQAALTTFWASFFFLVGSMVQLYESLDKYPVDNSGKSS